MANETVDALKKSIIDAVESRAKKFIDDNADAKAFLYNRAQRMAELAVEYAMTADESEKLEVKAKMDLVRQTMENEISAVAVNAQSESKNLFKAILGTAMDVLIKALPTILAVI